MLRLGGGLRDGTGDSAARSRPCGQRPGTRRDHARRHTRSACSAGRSPRRRSVASAFGSARRCQVAPAVRCSIVAACTSCVSAASSGQSTSRGACMSIAVGIGTGAKKLLASGSLSATLPSPAGTPQSAAARSTRPGAGRGPGCHVLG